MDAREEAEMDSEARQADAHPRLAVRLEVVDGGKVLCPSCCAYRPVEDCVACAELTRIESGAVVCHPEVDRTTSGVIHDMMVLDVLLGPGVKSQPDTPALSEPSGEQRDRAQPGRGHPDVDPP